MMYGHRLLKTPQGKLKRLTKIEPKKICEKVEHSMFYLQIQHRL